MSINYIKQAIPFLKKFTIKDNHLKLYEKWKMKNKLTY